MVQESTLSGSVFAWVEGPRRGRQTQNETGGTKFPRASTRQPPPTDRDPTTARLCINLIFSSLLIIFSYTCDTMTGRGGGRGGAKTLLAPIHFIFKLLQQRSTVSIWLYEQVAVRIEGKIRVSTYWLAVPARVCTD